MRITTTVDLDAGRLTIDIEGRVELLPLDFIPRFTADTVATVLANEEADSHETQELRASAERLLATGLTDQQVAETIGVDAELVRRWDDDAAMAWEIV